MSSEGLNPEEALLAYRPDLAAVLQEASAPRFRYVQVYEHLMQRPMVPFAEASNLPKGLRARLDEAGASVVESVRRQDDPDGTTKLLLRGRDGQAFETVLMRYRQGSTVCVSSQVGCSLACTFCATGAMGFRRNLTTAEIVDQVRTLLPLLAEEERRLTNVVYMGMGEPLLNLEAVLPSLALLHDEAGLNLARRAISVSTVGVPKGIRRLAKEEPQVNLALSLHAPDEVLRNQLIPAGRRFSLAEVLSAVEDHFRLTHRKLFVEYLMLGGVNDTGAHARALADLMRGRVVTVNLIPWNAACGDFRASSRQDTARFVETLKQRGIEVTVRESRGWSIAAACGQLAGEEVEKPTRQRRR